MTDDDPVSRRDIKVQSALLAREYTVDLIGDNLLGVFDAVTPLGDLRAGKHGETRCYAYIKFIGLAPRDVVGLHIVDGEERMVRSYPPCEVDEGSLQSLTFTITAPLTIPHFVYGLHKLIIHHNDVEVGSIPFDVRPMPDPFR